ncbi:uncharacterized protein [Nerophis lumbriciformis]|uniref:uncharacterized protein n=1 Tax=Nerophis lumbriciformis TaxID=546530 RepID=UPI002ADF6164|nr:Fanconi anemia core complex-associated protein 20-like [Nerophis lumbriciformis]
MADSRSRSNFSKRKHNFVQNDAEIIPSGSSETNNAPKKTKISRSAGCGSAWWNTKDLSAAEHLWAQTLRSAIPYLDDQHWEQVPHLPPPSVAEGSLQRLHEHRCCELSAESLPFPEPRPPQSPDHVSPQHIRPARDTADSSPGQEQEVCVDASSNEDQSSKEWEEEEGLKGGGEEKMETPAKVSERNPRKKEEGAREELKGTKDDVKVKRSEVLRSCPMCLQVFPDSFSQMDCDGHLAQCLSDMNVDMAW